MIAAIEGWCVAGGVELAAWCDLRVASETARFGCLERRWGVPLIDGGTYRLPRIVGLGRALDLILTGREFDVAEAERIGFVNRVVPAGGALDAAIELAEQIASFPWRAVVERSPFRLRRTRPRPRGSARQRGPSRPRHDLRRRLRRRRRQVRATTRADVVADRIVCVDCGGECGRLTLDPELGWAGRRHRRLPLRRLRRRLVPRARSRRHHRLTVPPTTPALKQIQICICSSGIRRDGAR